MTTQDHQQICCGIWSHAIDSQQLFTKFKSGRITCFERFKIVFSGSNTKSKIINCGRAIPHAYFFPDECRSGGGNCFRCGEGFGPCTPLTTAALACGASVGRSYSTSGG